MDRVIDKILERNRKMIANTVVKTASDISAEVVRNVLTERIYNGKGIIGIVVGRMLK